MLHRTNISDTEFIEIAKTFNFSFKCHHLSYAIFA